MEKLKRTVPTRQCEIDGCSEISVGSKVLLCRKHRNKTYKQNYKKKRKHAEGNFEVCLRYDTFHIKSSLNC